MRANYPKHYFVVDLYKEQRRKSYIRTMQICDFLSRSVLQRGFYSWKDDELRKTFQTETRMFWQFNNIPPSPAELDKFVIAKLMWYIKTHITIQDKIWNGSFLHGLAQSGKILKLKSRFLSLQSFARKRLLYIVRCCPFQGTISDKGWDDGLIWRNVPALSLSHDVNTLSFMAGVFSMGQEWTNKDGKVYARYSGKCKKWFDKWGIPIEGYSPNKLSCLISPFWPALLHEWMPPILRTWQRIPNAYNANKYAAILWKIYHGGQFETAAIPYLLSPRQYVKMYTVEEHTLTQNMKRMWVECNLTMLDERLKGLIRAKNFV